MLLRWLSACVFVGGLTALFVACGEESQTLCEPGTEVFCKCRCGFEGTKTCGEDGASFGECTTAEGTCPEIPDTTSSTGDTGSTTSGSGGGGTGTLGLYEACTDGSECQSGTCEGFCTRTCASWEECTVDAEMLYGDCVVLAGGTKQVCAPYCASPTDCPYGPEVQCGGATALDDPMIYFGACAPWGDELYFLLGGLLQKLVYLSVGLAVLLAFIGVKLLLHALHENELPFINGGEHVAVPEIPIAVSLGAIVVILGVTTLASLWKSKRDAQLDS